MGGRLIDADKLKAHYAWWKGGTREMTMDEAKSDFDTIIDLQQTVEPVKHGRWINKDDKVFECSHCGNLEMLMSSYCRHCGAKMDEVTE